MFLAILCGALLLLLLVLAPPVGITMMAAAAVAGLVATGTAEVLPPQPRARSPDDTAIKGPD